jgi:tetratricopeptide (TPR) repeat protein/tRNA A-37 threonylcarbamoyl transferase component Bud32
MGVVYLAYDPELDRRVALKLLRPDGDARGLQLREAQALARLAHPNVVTVHDVGTHHERVWLAMEFVEGLTLKQWCMQRERSWREVLAVLVAAGRGLAAAHAVNVVHRDFKPDNVMITPKGVPGENRVLVMDFGLARAFGDEEDATSSSSTSQLRVAIDATHAHGTPGYMAREQHAGAVGDGRTDQFGFCVTLWEALFGERPFRGETLGALVLAVTTDDIRPPPATRVVPRWLRRAVERGLSSDPAKRWPSMDALLDELHRGHTRLRRRWIVGACTAAVLLLAGGLVVRELQHRRAVAACVDDGATGWNDELRTQMKLAFVRAAPTLGEATAMRATERLDEWSAAWQDVRRTHCVAAIDRVDPDEAAIASCLAERRAGFVALVETFVEADAEVVRRAVSAAAGLARPEPCAEDPDLLRRPPPPSAAAEEVAELRRALERSRSLRLAGRYAAARTTIEEAVAGARALGWAPLVAATLVESGRIADKAGDAARAETSLQSAYLTAVAADEPALAAEAATALVTVVGVKLARPDDGRLWGLQAEALLERIGASEGVSAATLAQNRGILERAAGRYDVAIEHLERALAIRRAALGEDHPDVASVLNNLGNVYQNRGDLDEAERLLTQVVEMWERVVGEEHPDTAQAINNLGNTYWSRGDLDAAERLYTRALAIKERTLPDGHPDIALTLLNLGAVAYKRGELERSIGFTKRALEIDRRARGGDHPEIVRELVNLGSAETDVGDTDAALAHFDEAAAMLERLQGDDPVEHARLLMQRGHVRAQVGRVDEAAADADAAAQLFTGLPSGDHPDRGGIEVLRGAIAGEQRNFAAAMRHCRRALEIYAELGRDHPDSVLAWGCLVQSELGDGRIEDAAADAERTRALIERTALPPRRVGSIYMPLARALWESGRDREGARTLATLALEYAGDPRQRALAETWLREHVASASPSR